MFMEQVYNQIYHKDGMVKAKLWLWSQVLRSIPPAVWSNLKWSYTMFKNHLKLAFRNIKRHKVFSFINIFGLAAGIASCFLILLWVHDEMSYDGYHKNADNIYRIEIEKQIQDNTILHSGTPSPLANAAKREIPEIIEAARFYLVGSGWLLKYEDKVFTNDRLGWADPSYFKIFDFKFIKGNKTAIDNPFTMVITEKMAKKYFGDTDPVGKIIKIHNWDFTVTGLIENVPHNSHMEFDCILPYDFWKDFGMDLEDWKNDNHYTYILLNKNVNFQLVNKKITSLLNKNLPVSNIKSYLQPLRKIYLYTDTTFNISGHGEIKYIYIFSTIACLILFIACFNFLNLSSAQGRKRYKEIGVRKVVGAKRTDLVRQFIAESFLITLLASFIAVIFIVIALPAFNNLSGKSLSINFFKNSKLVAGFVFIAIFTGFLSGSYPAFYLSSFKPLNVLKGIFDRKADRHSSLFRKIVVIFQFTVSVFLIIIVMVIFIQLKFVNNKDLGFQKDCILHFLGRGDFAGNFESLRNELLKNPKILNTAKGMLPLNLSSAFGTKDINWQGKSAGDDVTVFKYTIGYEYIETYQMKIIEGRSFAKEHSTDKNTFIINEEAAKVMGFESPLGKRITLEGKTGSIIGVVENFHINSLRNKIEPVIMPLGNHYIVSIRVSSEDIESTLKYLEEKWKEAVPGYPFDYNFLDEQINSYYRTDNRVGEILKCFTVIAILISCLGLFGLTLFITEQRTKEIGVRKVFGAVKIDILRLFFKDSLKLLIISNFIGWTFAWYFAKKWLQNFAYKINLNIGYFLISGLLILIIAMISISYYSIKASRKNAVDSLKYE